MKIYNPYIITLNTAGQTITIDTTAFLGDGLYDCIILKGSGTLTGNISLTYSGTPLSGTIYPVYYNADITLSTYSITLFAQTITQQEAKSGFRLTCCSSITVAALKSIMIVM